MIILGVLSGSIKEHSVTQIRITEKKYQKLKKIGTGQALYLFL
jgi:hypothetical protein